MRYFITSILIVFIKIQLVGQISVEVTTLDSFNTTAIGQHGVNGLNATTYNDQIHLTYYFSDNKANTWLLYSIRDGVSLTTDTLAEIVATNSSKSETAIQFDSLGNVWIYAGYTHNNSRYIKAYTMIDSTWEESFSVLQLGSPEHYVVAAPHGEEIGFAYAGIRIPPTENYPIRYASYNGSTWDKVTISEDDKSHKTKPSIAAFNNQLYLTFAESRCPDTLVTRVYTKAEDNWSISAEDVWAGDYNCESIKHLGTKVGSSDQGVYFLYDVHTINDKPIYHRNQGFGWEQIEILSGEELGDGGIVIGSNLVIDEDQTAYWLSQEDSESPALFRVKINGDPGKIAIPHTYDTSLEDMTILNGYLYIYYFEGNYGWPWGKPVTFKEAKVKIDELVQADYPDKASSISLEQNSPNPFSQSTTITIHLPSISDVSLVISDIHGRPIQTLARGKLLSGQYQFPFYADNLSPGMYYYSLVADGKIVTKKMILIP